MHAQGLKAAYRFGNFAEAHDLFSRARAALHSVEFVGEAYDASRTLQEARIARDDGFISARQAIAEGEVSYFVRAVKAVTWSHDSSQTLVDRGQIYFPEEAWRYLLSEHGATIGVLGRLATVGEVLGYEGTDLAASAFYFRQARGYLSEGSNCYYETSNAMNAARSERAAGRPFWAARWLARSTVSLVRSMQSDRQNTWPSLRTFAGRLPHLTTRRAAQASVITRP